MKKWYKEAYFNSKEWLLTNFELLNISCEELVLLLLIIYANDNNIQISNDYFVNKMHLSSKNVDSIISKLVDKKYLSIKLINNNVQFNIDGIYEMDPANYIDFDNKDIFDLVSEVFSRPLSSIELQKISDLLETYGADKFDDALRISESYNKLSISYIEAILKNEQNKQ